MNSTNTQPESDGAEYVSSRIESDKDRAERAEKWADELGKRCSEFQTENAKLKAELDRAQKACAEMRNALVPFQCETCNGTHLFTFECPGCLTGEGECTCDKQQPEPCPQCQSEAGKQIYANLEHALAHANALGIDREEK